ncbi:biliverdin-producing heme oxygenase [Neokomagataea anthophila]|uniref:Biliverdin-producing heme oxygenase n=1 Tax=Neokomagataea anthophila TaxID=2826925 RepID=A0ABS5E537_9PROT|nr:biliverdin-producing heme oxygenase [Neokomagataea anthophila]MBR0559012.1 biliverdin-producing heme oxygenase [Neokomagataea anthophila]
MAERRVHSDDFLTELRKACRTEHDGVDQVFSRFDLQDPEDYGAFLCAHARVVPVLERWLKTRVMAAGTVWRASALASDICALGHDMPSEIVWHPMERDGYAMGVHYVLEGSKLGGRVLAARVPVDLPQAYLSSGHQAGAWPQFLQTLRGALTEGDGAYRADVLAGARQAFTLFAVSGRRVA